MNPRTLALVPLLLASLACATRNSPAPVVAELSGPSRLTVRLLGLESDDGTVALALYDSAESYRKRSGAVATARIEPRDGMATWIVEGLEPGVYAVAAYHDLDGDGRLRKPSVGPPTEPYGFSNDARGTLGPPGFDKASIEVGSGDLVIEITLR